MKRAIVYSACVVMMVAGMAGAGDGTKYGAGVTLDQAVPIAKLMANPADYMGKKVRVDGVITGVCKMRGCWMQVTDDEGNGVRIKVEDGVIVFPATSMGHQASAEGVFEGKPVAAEEKKHQGGGKDEHEACDSKPQGEMLYFIEGTGAVIQD